MEFHRWQGEKQGEGGRERQGPSVGTGMADMVWV